MSLMIDPREISLYCRTAKVVNGALIRMRYALGVPFVYLIPKQQLTHIEEE